MHFFLVVVSNFVADLFCFLSNIPMQYLHFPQHESGSVNLFFMQIKWHGACPLYTKL